MKRVMSFLKRRDDETKQKQNLANQPKIKSYGVSYYFKLCNADRLIE